MNETIMAIGLGISFIVLFLVIINLARREAKRIQEGGK